METSGMASTMQEIEALTLKLPVKEDTFSLLIQDMKEPVARKVYRTKGSESFELRYFDKQGELHKYELSHASKKRKMTDTIDCSKPMTLHVIKYDGSECEVVETDVETYHMWNTIRILPRGVGNQLNDSEISRIVSAFKYNHETFGLFIYYLIREKSAVNFLNLNRQMLGCLLNNDSDDMAFLSGKRDSNPRPPAWEASALPTELLPQAY